MTKNNLPLYEKIINSSSMVINAIHDDLTPDEWIELISKGVIVTLESISNSQAIDLLYSASSNHTFLEVRAQAFLSLKRLAEVNNTIATDAIYKLAIENGLLAARQWIETHHQQPSTSGLLILYDFFYKNFYPKEDAELAEMHQAFFEVANPNLQERLLTLANQRGLVNWALIVNLENQLMNHEPHQKDQKDLDKLVDIYPSFSAPERGLVLTRLSHIARCGPADSQTSARETIARLFLDQEDMVARDIALENHYFPIEPEKRAIFFFLTCRWPDYEAIDINHSLLTNAFEFGSKNFRRRLMDHGRKYGYMDWIRGPNQANEVRWPGDLTDADWEHAIDKLIINHRWNDLFQLAQASPIFWSAKILTRLGNEGWQPQEEADKSAFVRLFQLASECVLSPLLLSPVSKKLSLSGLNCLAMHPQGISLAGGSSGQEILLWTLPQLKSRIPNLNSPSPVVRSLAFSPDGSMLAATTGDHRIRIYRVNDGALIKTFEGHSAMVRSLAIHPDGRLLASASFDGSVRLWRFPNGPELKKLTTKTDCGEIFNLSITPDGQRLLTAGSDQMISIWSLPDGGLLNQLKGHSDTITHLAISPTIDWVASFSRDRTIRIWNYNSGRLVNSIDLSNQSLTSLLFHPMSNILIGAGVTNDPDNAPEIMVWNISTGKLLEKVSCHSKSITGMVISPGGDCLYSCDSTGNINSLDIRNFLFIRTFTPIIGEFEKYESVSTLKFSPEMIVQHLSDTGISTAERNWLRYTLELIRYRQRYDIDLAESSRIPVGEFDIEL